MLMLYKEDDWEVRVSLEVVSIWELRRVPFKHSHNNKSVIPSPSISNAITSLQTRNTYKHTSLESHISTTKYLNFFSSLLPGNNSLIIFNKIKHAL